MASKTSPQALVEHALATSRSDDCVVIVQARTAANLALTDIRAQHPDATGP